MNLIKSEKFEDGMNFLIALMFLKIPVDISILPSFCYCFQRSTFLFHDLIWGLQSLLGAILVCSSTYMEIYACIYVCMYLSACFQTTWGFCHHIGGFSFSPQPQAFPIPHKTSFSKGTIPHLTLRLIIIIFAWSLCSPFNLNGERVQRPKQST